MGLFNRTATLIGAYEKLVDTLRAEAADREERHAREKADLFQRIMVLTNPAAVRQASTPPARFVGMTSSKPPTFERPDLPEFLEDLDGTDSPEGMPARPAPRDWAALHHPEYEEIARRRAEASQSTMAKPEKVG